MTDKLLILLLLALPFERVLTFGLFGFTAKPPYFAGGLLALNLIYKMIKTKSRLKLEADEIFLFLFVFWSYFSTLWSIEKRITLIVSTMFLLMAAIYYAVKHLAKKEKIEKYFDYFIILGVLTSLFGFYQFFGDMLGLSQHFTLLSDLYIKKQFGFPRIQSTFFEPGFFANFLLIPLYLSFYSSLFKKNSLYKVALAIISVAFFLTLSRGGIFAFGLTLIPFIITLILTNKGTVKKHAISILIIALSFFVCQLLIYSFLGRQGIKTYFGQSVNSSDVVRADQQNIEATTRAYTIRVALKNWQSHKLTGIGTGAFGALPEFEIRAKEYGNSRQTVNSLYPEILVEDGLIGLTLLAAFLVCLIIKIYKKTTDKNIAFLEIAIIAAIFIQYISFSTLYLVYIWVFLGLASAPTREQEKLL